jgi:hypothetical protein
MGDKLTQSFHVFYKPKVEQDSIAYVWNRRRSKSSYYFSLQAR